MKQITWLVFSILLALCLLMAACGPAAKTTITGSPPTPKPEETSATQTTPAVSTPVPTPEQTTTQTPISYTITTSVNPPVGGYLSISSGQYRKGEIYVTATPYPAYAFDYWSGNASGKSPSILVVVDSDKVLVANFVEVAPPVISNVATVNITDTNATIEWDTDEPATSQIEYGATSAYGSISPLDSQLVNKHSVTLSGLAPNTVYQFRIKSADKNGNGSRFVGNAFSTKRPVEVVSSSISRSGGGVTYTLINNSSQTITVIRAELVDNDGVIRHTDDSIQIGLPYMTRLPPDNMITESFSSSGQSYSGWRAIWYCTDIDPIPFSLTNRILFTFTVTSNSISP